MTRIRISACNVLHSLVGSNITSGTTSTEENATAKANVLQLSLGNKIGHNPLLLKKFLPKKEHSRPSSIFEIVNWFNGSVMESKLYKILYYHLDDQKSPTRLLRSEFREMVSIGCAILTHYYDVLSGELGFKDDKGKRVRISYEFLAKKLSVSLIRVKRFFKFLKDRGLVSIQQDKNKDEKGNWTSNISRKFLKPAFFIDTLGIQAWRKIQRLKDWILKRSRPKTKDQKENVSTVNQLIKNAITSLPRIVKRISHSRSGDDGEKEKTIIARARYLFERDSSRSLGEYYQQIKSATS